jgi:hypothetical protein
MRMPPGQPVFTLRVTLDDVKPLVWRRILVPGSVRLDKLHRMLQAAMGWQDYHLHSFEIGHARFGMQFDDFPEGELDEKAVLVLRAIGDVRRLSYEYDFGDSWGHDVVVESLSRSPVGLKFGVCVNGQNACPPEDCGGPSGYADLLEVLADPTHDEHEHMSSWVGGPFDPAEFDLASANARLQAVH